MFGAQAWKFPDDINTELMLPSGTGEDFDAGVLCKLTPGRKLRARALPGPLLELEGSII